MSSRQACRGIAIVAVMWLTATLSLVAAGVVANVRVDLRATHLSSLFAAHAALGDAAIRLAILDLRERHPLVVPYRRDIVFEGVTIRVEALPAEAFVDLNSAPLELLRDTLVHGAAVGEDSAQTLAERIVNWRDPYLPRLPRGAVAQDYAAAGSPFRPRNGGFDAASDLIQVLGFDLALHERLDDLVTVHNPSGGVDPRFAPASVLHVVAGGNRALVARFLENRRSGNDAPPPPGFTDGHLVRSTGDVYRVTAYRAEDGLVLARERWVSLDRDGLSGAPWREFDVRPVRATQVQETPHGG